MHSSKGIWIIAKFIWGLTANRQLQQFYRELMKLISKLYFGGLTYFTIFTTIFNTMFYYTDFIFLSSNSYSKPYNVIKNKPYFSEKWDILFL